MGEGRGIYSVAMFQIRNSLITRGCGFFITLPTVSRVPCLVVRFLILDWNSEEKGQIYTRITHGKTQVEALFLFRALCRLYLYSCLPNVYQFNPAIHWRAAVSRCAPFLLPFCVYQMSTTGTFKLQIQIKIIKYHAISSLLIACKGRHTALISLFYRILGLYGNSGLKF